MDDDDDFLLSSLGSSTYSDWDYFSIKLAPSVREFCLDLSSCIKITIDFRAMNFIYICICF